MNPPPTPIRLDQHPEIAPMTPHEYMALNTGVAAAEAVFERTGEIRAGLLIFDNPTDPTALAIVDLKGASKADTGTMIHHIEQECPLVFIAEAWFSHYEKAASPELLKAITTDPKSAVYVRPMDDPQRREAVIARLHHKGRVIMASAEIIRSGESVKLLPFKFTDNAAKGCSSHGIEHGDDRTERL